MNELIDALMVLLVLMNLRLLGSSRLSTCIRTAAIEGIPKVLSIRGSDWNVLNDSIGFHYFHTRLARGMTRWSLGHYDCVLTASCRLAADVHGNGAAIHVTVDRHRAGADVDILTDDAVTDEREAPDARVAEEDAVLQLHSVPDR